MASLFRRSNGIYYLVSLHHVKRVWESTGSKNKSEALRYLVERKRQAKDQRLLTFSQFRTQFKSYSQSNLAPSTSILYDGRVERFYPSYR